ncbi:hypothetical protein ACQ4PT_012983 [Festuca glaucescens]
MDVSDNAICFPYDVLLDILARLPARLLAGCRRVCRAWRAIVDAHARDLLLPFYFPQRDFPGIFVTKSGCRSICSFFGPRSWHKRRYRKPSSQQPVYPHEATIRDSCNGLLFLEDRENYYVFNPATARYDRLPCPSSTKCCIGAMSLAFDPAVSLHYEVSLHEDALVQKWLSARHRNPDGWTLAHNANLEPIRFLEPTNVTWGVIGSRGGPVSLIEDGGYGNVEDDGAGDYDSDYSWNSDEENFVDVVDGSTFAWRVDCRVIGFHPHKNAFILLLHRAVVVYHLETFGTQFLGYESEFMDDALGNSCVNGSFIYRGC